MNKTKNSYLQIKDRFVPNIEINILKIMSIIVFFTYAYILVISNFLIYSNDGNETLGTLLHADNLIKYGFLNNFLTDESTGVEKQQHPISHLSQGNWPRISVALLKLVGLNDILIISLVTLAMVAIFLIVYPKIMIHKTSRIFTLIFLFLFVTDFLHVTQWFLNLYRTWQVALYFFVLFIISKIETKRSNGIILYTILSILFAISTYGELINAIWLFIATSFLLLFQFFSFSNLKKIYLFSVMIIGSIVGFGIHVIQVVLTIGVQDTLFYFTTINGVRNNGLKSFEMNEIAEKHNLVFWQNYGPNTDNLQSIVRLYLDILIDLFASSLLINLILPVVFILLIAYASGHKKFTLLLLVTVNIYFILSDKSYFTYLFIIIVLIAFYLKKILPPQNLFIVKSGFVGLFIVSALSTLLPPLYTWGINYTYAIWAAAFSAAIICLYLVIKKIGKNFKDLDFNMNYLISITLLSLLNYSLQKQFSYRLYYPELINLNYTKLILLFVVYASYIFFLIRWLWNLSDFNLKGTSKVFSFVLAPALGLIIVGLLSPGYVLTGYFLREDFLWKGLGSSILGLTIYLSIKSYSDNSQLTNFRSQIASFIWLPIIYLLIQFNVMQVQPHNSFFEVGKYIEKVHSNKVLISNNYPPAISHFSNNYSVIVSFNELESFVSAPSFLGKFAGLRFPDRLDRDYSKVENFIFLDVNTRFNTTHARYIESKGKPMPASSYCQLFLDRNFISQNINLILNPGAFGNIGPYGYWCDFKVKQKI
jgi:hypothetical protein